MAAQSTPLRSYLQPVWVIAFNTFREIIRDRLLYGVLVVALLVTAASFFLSTVSLGEDDKVLFNTGLSAIHFFAFFITVFVITNSLHHDAEKRALYLLFSKPISRAQYVLGKYVGGLLLLATTLLILGGLYTAGASFLYHGIAQDAVVSLLFSFAEISLLCALAVLFASFAAPLNASLYTIGLYIIGHSLETMRKYVETLNAKYLSAAVDTCYYLLPNLEKFNVRPALLYDLGIPAAQFGWVLLYWLLFTGLALGLAVAVMRGQEV
jgi:ABC-type transport system involved in multi-copper enzyme maturation permease subunit